MAITSSGEIKISDINTEFGRSGTTGKDVGACGDEG